jgi:hypothetical protein
MTTKRTSEKHLVHTETTGTVARDGRGLQGDSERRSRRAGNFVTHASCPSVLNIPVERKQFRQKGMCGSTPAEFYARVLQ